MYSWFWFLVWAGEQTKVFPEILEEELKISTWTEMIWKGGHLKVTRCISKKETYILKNLAPGRKIISSMTPYWGGKPDPYPNPYDKLNFENSRRPWQVIVRLL